MKNKILILIIAVLLIITIYQSNIIFNLEEVNYSENDMYRIKDIILENTEITDLDYQIYDLNNDGIIDGLDMMAIKRDILEIEKIPITKILQTR